MLNDSLHKPGGVLCLHSISEPQCADEANYYVSPRRFRRFMYWLKTAGYQSASLADWLEGELSSKRVLLTFDDAYDDIYNELFPAVIESGWTPLIFVVADRIGGTNTWDDTLAVRQRNLLKLDQIREMQKHGIDFGSHTLTHPWLPDESDAQLRREVFDSKLRLEDLLGTEVTSFAYPFGGVDERVRAAVADAGYKVAFSINATLKPQSDPLCIRRAEVSDKTSLLDFASKLHTGYSLRQAAIAQLRTLQQTLPTRRLRNGACALEHATRHIQAMARRRG